jgi:Raf kinase inhibitor-like YbhB/YbcL family protein
MLTRAHPEVIITELKKIIMKQELEATTSVGCRRLRITSSAFNDSNIIPERYTCDGQNVNPPLKIQGIPAATRSLAIIMDDADAPGGTIAHWVMWNIPVTNRIKENEAKGLQGLNDFERHRYNGPCPPKGNHRYTFKVYAINRLLDLPASTTRSDLERAISDDIIGFGELTGLYGKI